MDKNFSPVFVQQLISRAINNNSYQIVEEFFDKYSERIKWEELLMFIIKNKVVP